MYKRSSLGAGVCASMYTSYVPWAHIIQIIFFLLQKCENISRRDNVIHIFAIHRNEGLTVTAAVVCVMQPVVSEYIIVVSIKMIRLGAASAVRVQQKSGMPCGRSGYVLRDTWYSTAQ